MRELRPRQPRGTAVGVGAGSEVLPLLGELHGRVDGVAARPQDVTPSVAQQQHAHHLLLPHLAGQVQRGLPLVIHLVQAGRRILP